MDHTALLQFCTRHHFLQGGQNTSQVSYDLARFVKRVSEEGNVYYYNEETDVTQWERP